MQDTKIYIKLLEESTPEQNLALQNELHRLSIVGNHKQLPNFWQSLEIWDKIPRAVMDTNLAYYMSGIDYDIMMLEGVEEVKYPVEKIKDKELLKKEIEFENSHFDFEKFYAKKMSGGAVVITKDKMLSAYSWIDHGATVLNIYNYLYDKDPKEAEWNYPLWQFAALEAGNIIVQLCDGCSSPVWIPREINDYQYNTLMGLVDHLTEIDERGNYQIELAIDTNGAATPIKDAKNKINEVCKQKGLYDVPKAK